jgi:hypothetical protein
VRSREAATISSGGGRDRRLRRGRPIDTGPLSLLGGPVRALALALATGCGGAGAAPAEPAPAAVDDLTARDVVGHWTGDWGTLYLRLEADGSVRGVYPRDDGALVGRVDNGVLTGWWCEAPTRRPDRDAGDVELVFERAGDRLILRGAWRDGATSEEWHRGWDLEQTETPVDFALLAAFDDEQRFCRRPD